MFNLYFGKKNKKLYKIVYKPEYGRYVDSCTLLIPASDPTNAVATFYKHVGLKVSTILEFTEITYGSKGAEIKSEQK